MVFKLILDLKSLIIVYFSLGLEIDDILKSTGCHFHVFF